MRILGIAGLNHDASVALLEDGRIRMAIESEKVTRHKQEVSVCPEEGIRFLLNRVGISLDEVELIATNWNSGPLANFFYLKHVFRFIQRNCYAWYLLPTLAAIRGTHHRAAFLRLQENRIPPIVRIQHHLAHLGSCYTVSPFEEAAVAILDGAGEMACTSLYRCRERRVQKLYSMDLPLDSLGHVYVMSTVHLGYRMLGEEYKVMGLAATGESSTRFEEFFRRLVALRPKGRYRVNNRLTGNFIRNGYRFPEAARSIIGPPRRPDEEIRQEHRDFAHALQSRLEEAVLHVVRHTRKISKSRYLCMAGGVALNSVANGRILEEGGFDDIFIQPAAHDAGTSLGAAAFLHYHLLKRDRPQPFDTAFLGPRYDDRAIETELRRAQILYRRLENPAETGAKLLTQGKVIGWFQGAAEFGPRALGNRSILADPRSLEFKDRVNFLIKEREGYRPFAPAILEEAMSEYFEVLRVSPYMLFVARVRREKQSEIPAVVHVDGTARPQSVSAKSNPLFYKLIQAFHRRSGIPVVLNTSFNVSGEPIVLRPMDAIRCFHGCGLDALIIGPFLVEKQLQAGSAPAKP